MDQSRSPSSDDFRRFVQEREQARARVHRLERQSGAGLWAVALFLAVSVVARFGLDALPSLSQQTRALLGEAPPVNLIHAALVIYSFAAIILILSRMTMEQPPVIGFAHVGYLTGFYVFYHLADGDSGNYWAVFAAGVTILSLAAYHLRNHTREGLRREREALQILERREKFLGIGELEGKEE